MSSTNTTPATCAKCATPATERSGWQWCDPCGIYLEIDPDTGEWISPAALIYRRNERDGARITAAQIATIGQQLAAARAETPAEYTVTSENTLIRITAAQITQSAAIMYTPDTDSWHIRITDHQRGVSAPIYNGPHVAYYPTAAAATRAAVNHLPNPAATTAA